jgi:hypothetical protein
MISSSAEEWLKRASMPPPELTPDWIRTDAIMPQDGVEVHGMNFDVQECQPFKMWWDARNESWQISVNSIIRSTIRVRRDQVTHWKPLDPWAEHLKTLPVYKYRCKMMTGEFYDKVMKHIKEADYFGVAFDESPDVILHRLKILWKDPKVYLPTDQPDISIYGKTIQYFIDNGVYTPESEVVILDAIEEITSYGRLVLVKHKNGKFSSIEGIALLLEYTKL